MIGKHSSRELLPLGLRNPPWLRFVKIESRRVYFGDPLPLLNLAIREVFECDRVSKDASDFKEKCEEIIKNYNDKLNTFGITLKLRKGSPFERHGRPYALRIIRKHKLHINSNKDNLVMKYLEVQRSKTLELFETSIWSDIFKSHKVLPFSALDYISRRRHSFENQFNHLFSRIFFSVKRWWDCLNKTFSGKASERRDESFFFLYGLNEICNTILNSFLSAYHGFFRSSFKAYRDVIETLALSIFLDLLNLRDRDIEQSPYVDAILDGWWHKAMIGPRKQKIFNYGEFKNATSKVLSYKENLQELEQSLNTSLFLALTGRVLCVAHAEKENCIKYSIPRGTLVGYLNIGLRGADERTKRPMIYKEVISRLPIQCSEEKCDAKDLVFVARIPTSSTLQSLAWKLISLQKDVMKKLQRKYDDYSWFVHPYLQTFQIHPFSSDLEVKLWLDETADFLEMIDKTVESLIEKIEKEIL